jgi:hypothetical protein
MGPIGLAQYEIAFRIQATHLHLSGIDHTRLAFRYQGRQYRLADVHGKMFEAFGGNCNRRIAGLSKANRVDRPGWANAFSRRYSLPS